MKTSVLCLILVFTMRCMAATTRYVSLDGTNDNIGGYINWVGAATTIQAAISVSADGDWIWVSNGIYNAGISAVATFGDHRVAITNSVTVAGWGNDRSALIVGSAGVRPVYMADGAKLIGFTITNGAPTLGSGGGILCASTNAMVSNCLVIANSRIVGGGVYRGTLDNCDIISNSATHGGGAAGPVVMRNCNIISNNAASLAGGVYQPTLLYKCDIVGNLSVSGGGGVYGNIAAESVVRACNIIGNTSEAAGGGVARCYVYDSMLISNTAAGSGGGGSSGDALYYMTNCTLAGNVAGNNGGGADAYTIYNCRLIDNAATNDGGGAHSANATCKGLFNCSIISNTALRSGGGAARIKLYNCEIKYNRALGVSPNGLGGGVYIQATEAVNNCLIIANYANMLGGGVQGYTTGNVYNSTIVGNSAGALGGAQSVTLYNTIVWDNQGGGVPIITDYYSCGLGFTGPGSINAAPCFVDPGGGGYGTNHIAGNYRLCRDSPGINAGTNLPWIAGLVDLDGRARIDRFSGRVDMGCYEFILSGTLYHVR